MVSLNTTHRRFGAVVLVGLSCLLLAAIELSAARAQDEVKQVQGAPKLIGSLSNKDATESQNEPPGIRSIAVSDDGKRLAILGYYGGTLVWDIAQAKVERQVEKPLPPAATALMATDVEPVFVAGSDSLALLKTFISDAKPARLQLQLWSVENGKSLYKADVPAKQAVHQGGMPIPQGSANRSGWNDPTISASADGTRLAVGINTIRREFDMMGVRMASMQARVAQIRASPLSDMLGARFPPSPTVISVLDVAKKRITTSITTERGFAPFALSADGKRLAIWDSGNARFAIYDVERSKREMTPISVCAAEKCSLFDLAFSGDARSLVATYRVYESKTDPNGTITEEISKEMYVGTWEVASGKSLNAHKLFVLNEKQTVQRNTALSADGRVVAGSAEDTTLRIVNTSDGKERARLDIPTKEGYYTTVLSQNGRYVAVSTDTGEVLVWDLETAN